jgi:hypothetical protein
VGEGVPLATTDKVAVCPELIVWLAGCVVIVGGIALTVIVAVLLLTNPDELVTCTQ